jgi:hypothetical protein
VAAHRYWRAVGIEAYGLAGLDITEFHLLAVAARVDASAALTSNVAPATGSLANLKDDDTSTGATWGAADLRALVLSWDFGSGGDQEVTDIRIGSSVDPAKFLLLAKLQWSDDATAWTDAFTFAGIAWPGARAKTTSFASPPEQVLASSPLLYYKLDEATGTAYADATGNGRHGVGSGTITPQAGLSADSSGSVLFASTTAQILTTDPFGAAYAGPWTVRGLIKTTSSGGALVTRGRDGFGSGWSISVGPLATTGVIGVSAVYSGAAYSANSVAGTYVYGTLAEVVAQYVPGTGLRVFLNGDLIATAVVPNGAALRDSTIGLTVGMGNGSAVVGTQCDEVAWWNTALTAAQIRAFVDAGKIARNVVRGRTAVQTSSNIPSGASIALPFGTVNIRPSNIRGRNDYLSGVLGQGIGRVRGFTLDYVNPLNKPYPSRVVLMREPGNLVVREQWSRADGSYDFQYIDELQSYTVVAYYLAHGKRAVITDGLTLANGKVELMA